MGIDWLHTLTGLTQSLQSFIWGMGVNWLDTVTSVVSLGVWGLNRLTQSLQSFIWEVCVD